MSKALRLVQITVEHQDCQFFTVFLTITNFFPKYLDNALTDFAETSRASRRLLEEEAPVNDFERTAPSAEKYGCK